MSLQPTRWMTISTVTGNDAKHTFQAPCCCFESGLTMDLLLSKTINVSID